MSSLLTNQASMTALLTLKKISSDMLGVQKKISTGLRISSAEDNIAYWGLANSMRSDKTQLTTVNDSLKIGQAKIGEAQAAVTAIRNELTGIKNDAAYAISNQNDQSKLDKLKDSVDAHLSVIKRAISNAAIDGENLLENDGKGNFEIVASFHRENGVFMVDKINLKKADLQLAGRADGFTEEEPSTDFNTNPHVLVGTGASQTVESTTQANERVTKAKAAHEAWVKKREDFFKAKDIKFTEPDPGSDHASEHAAWLAKKDKFYADAGKSGMLTDKGMLKELFDKTINPFLKDPNAKYNVTTINKFSAVLDKVVESLNGVDATLAVAKKEVDSQMDFIGLLTNNLDKSVGALVDADMDAESARLSAIQVQQQLAVQALSIANQSTQHILSLYRQ